MDAWILDESPGSYRRGEIRLPPLRDDDVLVRVRASALNGAAQVLDSAADRWGVQADVVCGGTSGPKVQLDLPRLFFKQIEIIGSTMGSYEEFAEVAELVAAGVPVHVDRVYPLAEYEAALARLADGEQLGKIVLEHDAQGAL